MREVIQRVRRAMLLRDGAGMTDGQLLGRYIEHRDEAAFEALMHFHSRMVFGVCRRILGSHHDAEEALQVTFLVLARKAAAVVPREMVGNWLHGVAYRTALKAKVAIAKRRSKERQAAQTPEFKGERDEFWHELEPLLDRELNCLPSKYRAPIVLCDLEGKTHKDAAKQLGWPAGTLSVRLTRARTMLAKRLARRGMVVSAGTLAVVLSQDAASAGVSAAVTVSTIKAASLPAASQAAVAGLISQDVVALTEGVLNSMLLAKLKNGMVALTLVALATLGAGGVIRQMPGAEPLDERQSAPVVLAEAAAQEKGKEKANDKPTILKYSDNKADGKKSIGGLGELIKFTLPEADLKVSGIRIHASRYGQTTAPKEKFLIYFLNDDMSEIVHTEMAPYSLFKRGEERWVTAAFPRPVEVPKQFWVLVDFRAHQSKGVYLSFDKSTGGKYSRVGLPGIEPDETEFEGDWMIEAVLTK